MNEFPVVNYIVQGFLDQVVKKIAPLFKPFEEKIMALIEQVASLEQAVLSSAEERRKLLEAIAAETSQVADKVNSQNSLIEQLRVEIETLRNQETPETQEAIARLTALTEQISQGNSEIGAATESVKNIYENPEVPVEPPTTEPPTTEPPTTEPSPAA